ncbi:hypothetical protein HY772_03285 [Candidatus Woesearchaeota archaeon]|nr:hypothetical protein [Candidatus Woesearchaeota archaeon]
MHRQQQHAHNKRRKMCDNQRTNHKHQTPLRAPITFVIVGAVGVFTCASIAAYYTAFSHPPEAKVRLRSSQSGVSSALIPPQPHDSGERAVKYSPRIDEATRMRVLQALPKSANEYYRQVTESEQSPDYDDKDYDNNDDRPINVYRIAQDAMSAEQFRILTRFGSNLAQDDYRKTADLLEPIEMLFGSRAKERAINFFFKDYDNYLRSVEAVKCNGYDPSSVFNKITYMKLLPEQLGVSNYFSQSQSELERRVWTMCADYIPQTADADISEH